MVGNFSSNSFKFCSHVIEASNVNGLGPSFALFVNKPSLNRLISCRISLSSEIHSGANPESINTLLSLRVVESTKEEKNI